MPSAADPTANLSEPPAWLWVVGFSAIGIAAACVPPLSVPAVVLILIGALSFPAAVPRRTRLWGRATTVFAAVGALIGLGRFTVSKAMLGMVEGGESAAVMSALWRLREVVLAEDAVRKLATWDPDGDHVGSASLVLGLTGNAPVRGDKIVQASLLNYAFHGPVDTKIGPALQVEGFLFVVCLPTPSGGWTARAGDPVDDERAERRYVAYAWPADTQHGMNTVFFTDEHERILVIDTKRGAKAPYAGGDQPPACDAALGKDGESWKPWKHKQPRKTLPGDPSPPGE